MASDRDAAPSRVAHSSIASISFRGNRTPISGPPAGRPRRGFFWPSKHFWDRMRQSPFFQPQIYNKDILAPVSPPSSTTWSSGELLTSPLSQ
jgi:hypothetical protein